MLILYIADVERDVGMKKLSQKEAAKVLEGMKVKIEIPKAAVTQWKRNIALDMAIEALKYSEIPNSSDTISRQAAIDALGKRADEVSKTIQEGADFPDMNWIAGMAHAIGIVKALPSVQPEIIRCKDCKHWKDSDGVYRRGIGAESKCPMNIWPVYDGVFYCGYAERRTDGSG